MLPSAPPPSSPCPSSAPLFPLDVRSVPSEYVLGVDEAVCLSLIVTSEEPLDALQFLIRWDDGGTGASAFDCSSLYCGREDKEDTPTPALWESAAIPDDARGDGAYFFSVRGETGDFVVPDVGQVDFFAFPKKTGRPVQQLLGTLCLPISRGVVSPSPVVFQAQLQYARLAAPRATSGPCPDGFVRDASEGCLFDCNAARMFYEAPTRARCYRAGGLFDSDRPLVVVHPSYTSPAPATGETACSKYDDWTTRGGGVMSRRRVRVSKEALTPKECEDLCDADSFCDAVWFITKEKRHRKTGSVRSKTKCVLWASSEGRRGALACPRQKPNTAMLCCARPS